MMATLAPVRPRVEPGLLLEDEFEEYLERYRRGLFAITGGPLSGKTTALEHLRARFGLRSDIDWREGRPEDDDPPGVVVFTSARHFEPGCTSYGLAPWGEDDWVEYLLAVHPDRCRSVMERVLADRRRDDAGGSPALWRIVLDRMAEDESIRDVRAAMRAELWRRFGDEDAYMGALRILDGASGWSAADPRTRILLLPPFACLHAADRLVRMAASGASKGLVHGGLAPPIAEEAGRILEEDLDTCHSIAERCRTETRPELASLLVAARIGWHPTSAPIALSGTYLRGAFWAGIDLHDSELRNANLQEADLSRCDLTRVNAAGADFTGARLFGAYLYLARARHARFDQAQLVSASAAGADVSNARFASADLSGALLDGARMVDADLRAARFIEANLRGANLESSTIDGADFTAARLDQAKLQGLPLRRARLVGATFRGADLEGCDLERVELEEPDFAGAYLYKANLIASRMRSPNFRSARLSDAGLANVDWEGADLRDANLGEARFGLGSTRCGVLPTGLPPLEGSRTGFYVDGAVDLVWRDPALVRRANLRFADLRGAIVKYADFYLVDLRDAVYDDAQREHFHRCGAILSPD